MCAPRRRDETMSDSPPRQTYAKYVFLDVVDFTSNNIEDQTKIVELLNGIVRAAVGEHGLPDDRLIYLPTGDGICVAITDYPDFDVHMRLALSILAGVHENNREPAPGKPRFEVRIGLNQDTDNIVTDINGKENIAGAGINDAQRIMNLSEGGQIFVSESVHVTLHSRKVYQGEDIFRRYELRVKRDRKLTVYQYVAPGRPGLNTGTPRRALRKDAASEMFRIAGDCGMQHLYLTREEAKPDILREIREAKQRVWVCGVGLAEKLAPIDFLGALKENDNDAQIRILLLDALRSAAMFRTFLEVSPEDCRQIIYMKRDRPPPLDPYFRKPLFLSFNTWYAGLKSQPDFNAAVRFYRHTPICWLLIVDSVAYFQPYLFGRGKTGDRRDPTLGHLMPVFKFAAQEEARTDTFGILENHFKKLWSTSDMDLMHIGPRIVNKKKILRRMFANPEQSRWFRYVYEVLHQVPGDDRRRHPRRPCESKHPPSIKVKWDDDGAPAQVDAEIINFSRDGMLLKLKTDKRPPVGAVATLNIHTVEKDDASEHLITELLDPSAGKFTVRWSGSCQNQFVIGLHARVL